MEIVAVVADDVALLRLGICAALEPMQISIGAQANAGRDLSRLVEESQARLVIVGTLADLPTPEVVRRLKQMDFPPRVVVLLPRTQRDEMAALLSLDTHALLIRGVAPDELTSSIEKVMMGERVVSPALLSALVGVVSPADQEVADEPVLTAREREVLALLAEGRSNREIAGELYVTLATVKTHLQHIYEKLGARNRNEALGRAVSVGLLN